jgi:hypothetical protein
MERRRSILAGSSSAASFPELTASTVSRAAMNWQSAGGLPLGLLCVALAGFQFLRWRCLNWRSGTA